MVDIAALVREFLLAQPSIPIVLQPTAGVPNPNPNNAIYAAADLPEGFDPQPTPTYAGGPGIQIFRSGGISPVEIPVLINGRVLLKVWDDKERYTRASNVYSAVRDSMHGACNVALDEGFLLSALEVTAPQETTDPDTGWVCIYAFYSVMARPN